MSYTYDNTARSRIYASLFSRRVVAEVLAGSYKSIDKIYYLFRDNEALEWKTYLDYFLYLYRSMMKHYRCEYVFKNEVINKILLRHFSNPNTVSFSEFRVNQSIADLVMFNGISRAYEIKTDYDSDKRLISQLTDYNKLFEKTYLVISATGYNKYVNELPQTVGIITFEYKNGALVHRVIREAEKNTIIDIHTLMRSIRATEYKNIVKEIYGTLPNVSEFDMFEACENLLKVADNNKVRDTFMNVIKQRKTNTQSLGQFERCFRQLGVATNMTLTEYHSFVNNLSKPIKI
jgi:hypothetical protein